MRSLREPLLEVGFGRYSGRFASGVEANNKLDLSYDVITHPEIVRRYPGLRAEIIHRLRTMAAPHNPDIFIPVPTGANGYARDVAAKRGVDWLELQKDPETGEIYYDGDIQAALVPYTRVVLIEDVPNALTSIRKTLDLLANPDKIQAVFGVYDRGDRASRPPLPGKIAVEAIVAHYIPAMLPPDDPLWKYTL